MKIAFITAGAGGMYCGSCLRDNALARAMMARGHDVLLIPTYTPTRTDEPNVSLPRVFLGGINVYLQHRSALFRHTPWFADRLLDDPRLLHWASGFAMKTDAEQLGALTVSMLRGEDGPDRKEFVKLATWLAQEVRPDIVDISNGLLLGAAAPLRRAIGAPILCTLSGEDLFLESLPEPWRREAIALARQRSGDVDAFITFSRYYAGFMAEYLGIPDSKLFQIPLGITLDGHGIRPEDARDAPAAGHGVVQGAGGARGSDGRFVIGYLARICPEKGLHLLCEAFRILHHERKLTQCRLHAAGYLGARDRAYFDHLCRSMVQWGLGDWFEYTGQPDRAGKIRFLQSLDVFSVPTVYRESKGLSILEAMANRVPVVQPWHGIFTEVVNATEGGVLVPPNDPRALADGIAQLLDNQPLREELGRRGRRSVEKNFSADRMADATLAVYEHVAGRRESGIGNRACAKNQT